MNQIIEIVNEYAPKIVPVLLALSIVIEITPIKINPWSRILKMIGKVMMDDTNKRIENIEHNVDKIRMEVLNDKTESMRWNILDFANSCRNGRTHTRSEWEHVMSQIDDYNQYVLNNHISNGVLDSEEKYLIQIFQERLRKNDFL